MKNFFRLIIGITAFLVITPVSLAKFCNPPDRTESIYEDIYCDVAMGGNEDMDDEMFEAIAEQLGYDITITDKGRLAKFIYDTGMDTDCASINQFITDEDIEYDDLPSDIQDACRKEDNMDPWTAWIRILSKVQSAYNKEKVLYHTKKTLEYEFKAAENFYDGELRDFGDAPFDLIVDLNLIETVLFGSKAKWDTNADVWQWPSDDTTAPTVVKAEAMDSRHVKVVFSEAIKLPKDLPEIAFAIKEQISPANTLDVITAELDTEDTTNTTVLLKTTKQTFDVNYTVTASNAISDKNGNSIVSGDDDSGYFLGSGVPAEDEEEDEEIDITPESEGITVEITEEEGVIPECVPEDSPDADHGDHPGGSDYINPDCGNNEIEPPEQCDDGNSITGDGCNQFCMLEDSGADLICQDPDAVTFGESQSSQQSDEQPDEQSEFDCPPGTLPNKNVTITGPPPIEPKYPEADQSANYPGPNVGGTFKEFPESTAPSCPPGYHQLDSEPSADGAGTSASGSQALGITIAGETYEAPVCIPTELCAVDLYTIQRSLLGDDWKENENVFEKAKDVFGEDWLQDHGIEDSSGVVDFLSSIEAMVCVTVTKHNRPESAYQTIEGCIDCHISAMADSLDKALESNVTPMCNTTSSFAISSRWGPTFTFSLTMAVKAKVKTWLSKTAEETIEKTDKEIENIEKKNKPKKPAVSSSETSDDQIKEEVERQEESVEATLNELKNYREVGKLASDSEFYIRIADLLEQMAGSFENIQGQYNAMATSSTKILSDTAECL